MRDLVRPVVVALAAVVVAGVVSGCTADAPKYPKEPVEGSAVAGFTHDGAVPIAVINSFEDTRRAILTTSGSDVAAAAACTFLTSEAQEQTVKVARRHELVDRNADCAASLQALVERRGVPARVESFEVTRAEDEVSEVLVVRTDGTAEVYTLTGDLDEDLWSIDTMVDAEAPADEPEGEPEDGIAGEVEGDGVDGATGSPSPLVPTVTVPPKK